MTRSPSLLRFARSRPVDPADARLRARGVGGTAFGSWRPLLAAALLGAELMACQKPPPDDVLAPSVEPPRPVVDVDSQPTPTGVTPAAGAGAAPPAAGSAASSAGESSPGTVVMPNPGPGRVVMDVAGKRIVLTADDGRAMKAGLLTRLRESNLADKDHLISLTEKAQPFLETGDLRIGVWLLQTRGDKLILHYRMPSEAVSAATFSANVTGGTGAWQVGPVVAGIVHYRR